MDRSLVYGGLGTGVGLYVSAALTRASYRGVRQLLHQGVRQWYPTVPIRRVHLAKQQLDLALFADDDTGTLLLTCTGVFYVTHPELEVYEFCRACTTENNNNIDVLPQVALLFHTCMFPVLHKRSFHDLQQQFQGKVDAWALHMLCNDAARLIAPPTTTTTTTTTSPLVPVYQRLFAPILGAEPAAAAAAAAPPASSAPASWFGWGGGSRSSIKKPPPLSTAVPQSPAQVLAPITPTELTGLCREVEKDLFTPELRFLSPGWTRETTDAATTTTRCLGVTMEAAARLRVVLVPEPGPRAFEAHNAIDFLNGFAVRVGRLTYTPTTALPS